MSKALKSKLAAKVKQKKDSGRKFYYLKWMRGDQLIYHSFIDNVDFLPWDTGESVEMEPQERLDQLNIWEAKYTDTFNWLRDTALSVYENAQEKNKEILTACLQEPYYWTNGYIRVMLVPLDEDEADRIAEVQDEHIEALRLEAEEKARQEREERLASSRSQLKSLLSKRLKRN